MKKNDIRDVKYLLIIIIFILFYDIKCSVTIPNISDSVNNLIVNEGRAAKRRARKKQKIKIYIVDGYKIELTARSYNGMLLIRGSISDGKPCKSLMISASFKSKSNKIVYANLIAKNVGPNKTVMLKNNRKIKNKNTVFYEVNEIEITEIE